MIDLHSHVLPGIDDGPPTIEGSLALARAAAAAGTRVLTATPHVSWRWRNDADTIAELTAALNERLVEEDIVTRRPASPAHGTSKTGERPAEEDAATAQETPLEIRAGAEIALTLIGDIEPTELRRLTLGGGPWLLVEPPFTPAAPNLDRILLELLDGGLRIVLAHPERCPAFQRGPEMVERLVEAGALTSITAGSLVGRFGSEARSFALQLARDGLLHNVASDAHDVLNRPPGIAAELEQAGLAPLARWLTEEVPAAILDGGEIPPRPATAPLGGEPARRRRWNPLGR
jgi:protein-tyrosine phosphatase